MDTEKEIIKVSKNNVEVKEFVLTKTDEKFYTGKTDSYGQDRLSSELKQINDQIDYWTKLDVEKYRKEKLDSLNEDKNKLLAIDTEMNKGS